MKSFMIGFSLAVVCTTIVIPLILLFFHIFSGGSQWF